MQEELFKYYSQTGGSMPAFIGARRPGMLGSGFFSTLARYAIPFLQNIGGRVMRVAANTVRDVVGKRQSLGDALLQHSSRELTDAMESPPLSNINKFKGEGMKKRKRALDIFTSLKRQRMK